MKFFIHAFDQTYEGFEGKYIEELEKENKELKEGNGGGKRNFRDRTSKLF